MKFFSGRSNLSPEGEMEYFKKRIINAEIRENARKQNTLKQGHVGTPKFG